jgi:hypothetical protein
MIKNSHFSAEINESMKNLIGNQNHKADFFMSQNSMKSFSEN